MDRKDIKPGDVVVVKRGSKVFQDFCYFEWPGRYSSEERYTFVVTKVFSGERLQLRGPHFGWIYEDRKDIPEGLYGNGALYVTMDGVERV